MVLQIEGAKTRVLQTSYSPPKSLILLFLMREFVSRAKKPAFTVWIATSWKGKGYLSNSPAQRQSEQTT